MRNYYLHDGSQQLGPFTLEEIKLQKLSKKTPVWFEGLREWTTADDIPELLLLLNNTPPPFTTTPPTYVPEAPGSKVEEYHLPNAEKRKNILPLIGGGVLLAALIIFFAYKNSTQAAVIEEVQQQQQAQLAQSNEKAEAERKIEDERKRLEDEKKRINDELSAKNMAYRNKWSNYITITNSDYRTSSLGGIYGLEIVVDNQTEYLMDEVVANIEYIKSNGGLYKNVQVMISNVPGHSRKNIAVENVERGTSVKISTLSVMSKKMHFYYSNDYFSGNNSDPYFYK